MENVVDALKIAFAVLIFTVALLLAMMTFSQARQTSEAVLYMSDKTNFYEYEEAEEQPDGSFVVKDDTGNIIATYTKEREVGIETIIPTLYRYYKENYTVIFEGLESKGVNPVYYLDSNISNAKWSKNATSNERYYFDLNSEIAANCPWVGTVNDIKKNLDLFLDGTSKYSSSELDKISFGNTARTVNYGEGFIHECKTKNLVFEEYLGEYVAERSYGVSVDSNGNPITDLFGNYIIKGENDENLTLKDGKLYKADGSEYTGALENDSTTIVVDGEIIDLVKQNKKRVIKYKVK